MNYSSRHQREISGVILVFERVIISRSFATLTVIHVRRFMLLLVDVECLASAMDVRLNSWTRRRVGACVSVYQTTTS